jgi:hypothetical protein
LNVLWHGSRMLNDFTLFVMNLDLAMVSHWDEKFSTQIWEI